MPYYDLQVELVDHLASLIEKLWELNANLSFEDALQQTYHEFGIFGFSKIKASKEKALLKKYKGMLWFYVGQYFKLPKILITFMFAFLLFTVFHYTEKDSVVAIVYILAVFLFEIIYHFYIFPKHYKIQSVEGKKFIITNTLRNIQASIAVLPAILLQLISFLISGGYPAFNLWFEIVVSFLIVGFTLLLIALSFYVPNKIREHFEAQFPQFVKS